MDRFAGAKIIQWSLTILLITVVVYYSWILKKSLLS